MPDCEICCKPIRKKANVVMEILYFGSYMGDDFKGTAEDESNIIEGVRVDWGHQPEYTLFHEKCYMGD